jgi:hypothetical protein
VLVVSWLLEREYRQHRVLDAELPTTYSRWLTNVDARLQRETGETRQRIVKVVIHPAEIETWAHHAGRQVNDGARLDFADSLWRKDDGRRRAGRDKAALGAMVASSPVGVKAGQPFS